MTMALGSPASTAAAVAGDMCSVTGVSGVLLRSGTIATPAYVAAGGRPLPSMTFEVNPVVRVSMRLAGRGYLERYVKALALLRRGDPMISVEHVKGEETVPAPCVGHETRESHH